MTAERIHRGDAESAENAEASIDLVSVLRELRVLRASAVKGVLFVVVAGAVAMAGCRQDMHDAPRYEPYEKSDFFPDKRSARPLVAGTVARGHLREDTPETTGKEAGAFVATLPVPVTLELVRRGQQRYDIFCSPCHGLTGRGDGMVVRRGFRPPASFHDPRLRAQPDGYIFDVMTSGFGVMPDYAAQLPVADRWAVVAYVRVLQLSQNATPADVPPDRRAELGLAGEAQR